MRRCANARSMPDARCPMHDARFPVSAVPGENSRRGTGLGRRLLDHIILLGLVATCGWGKRQRWE